MKKFTCAICAELVDHVLLEPLGKDDAMVNVCLPCAREPPVEIGPRLEHGYQPSGGLLTDKQITAACRKAMGDEVYERQIAVDVEIGKTPFAAADPYLFTEHTKSGAITNKRHTGRRRSR